MRVVWEIHQPQLSQEEEKLFQNAPVAECPFVVPFWPFGKHAVEPVC